jgi:hypothetical protein
MRRVLIGLLLGALIFGVAFAGAKVATVTNPMGASLDGGGFNIGNVTNYETAAGAILGGDGITGWTVALAMSPQTGPSAPPFTLDFAGTADPSVAPPIGNNPVGSVYRRRVDSAHGELWFKTGPAATDWVKVAG